jgi:putative transposase
VLPFILSLIAAARVFFQSRTDTAVAVLALRQQVAVLKRRRPRPPLRPLDRLFWTLLRATWSRWKDALVIVKPETVVGWHRAGFRLYWRWKSRRRDGRPRINEEIRVLIRRLAQENSDWGAPKIHGELQKLGFVISERTVARYLRSLQRRGDPAKKWLAFLRNHREAIVALDLFTVPTATFRVCTVSSSSSTSAAGFSTSTLRRIHRPIGSCSSCEKPFQRRLPIATPFWITIRSSTSM